MAVTMVISTKHDKIMQILTMHVKLKKFLKGQSFTHLAIAMMKLWKHHDYEFLKLSQTYDAIIEQEFVLQLSVIS